MFTRTETKNTQFLLNTCTFLRETFVAHRLHLFHSLRPHALICYILYKFYSNILYIIYNELRISNSIKVFRTRFQRAKIIIKCLFYNIFLNKFLKKSINFIGIGNVFINSLLHKVDSLIIGPL